MALAILVLAVPVGATPESFVMGPYTVSFDMGKAGAHTSSVEQSNDQTLEGFPYTIYEASIEGISPAEVIMWFYDYHGLPMSSNIEQVVKEGVREFSSMCGEPIIIRARTIDDKPGIVGQQSCLGSELICLLFPSNIQAIQCPLFCRFLQPSLGMKAHLT